jgi:hypothetical protein
MIDRYYADIGGWRLAVLFHDGRKWLKLLDAERALPWRPARQGSEAFPNHHPISHRRKRHDLSFPTYAAAVAADQYRSFKAKAPLLHGAGP